MKSLAISLLLLTLVACSGPRASRTDQGLSPGVIESVQPIDLSNPAAPPEDGDDDPDPMPADSLVVRLDDGRTIYMTYTGPRRFEPGEAVRVRIDAATVFIL